MAVAKGTKLHSKASIRKMLATRRRNKAIKLQLHRERMNRIPDSSIPQGVITHGKKEAIEHINLPGVSTGWKGVRHEPIRIEKEQEQVVDLDVLTLLLIKAAVHLSKK